MQRAALRGGITVLAGNGLIAAGSFGTYAVLARLLDAQAFGRASAALALVNLCALVSIALGNAVAVRAATLSATLPAALPLYASVVLKRSAWLLLTLTTVLLVVALPLARFFGLDGAAGGALAVACGTAVVSAIPRGYAQGISAFGAYAGANGVEVIVRLSVALMLASRFGEAGAIGAFAVGAAISIAAIAPYLMRRGPARPAGTSVPQAAFDAAVAIGTVVVTAMTSLDLVVVGHVATPMVASSYAAVALIGRAEHFALSVVATVLLPAVATEHAMGGRARRLFATALGGNLAAAGIIVALFFAFGDAVIGLFAGIRFISAAGELYRYGAAVGLLSAASVCTTYCLARGVQWSIVVPLAVVLAVEVTLLAMWSSSLVGAVDAILAGHALAFVVSIAIAGALLFRSGSVRARA